MLAAAMSGEAKAKRAKRRLEKEAANLKPHITVPPTTTPAERNAVVNEVKDQVRIAAKGGNPANRGRALRSDDIKKLIQTGEAADGFSYASYLDTEGKLVPADEDVTMATISGTEYKLPLTVSLDENGNIRSGELSPQAEDDLIQWVKEMEKTFPQGVIYVGGWLNPGDADNDPRLEINLSLAFEEIDEGWLFAVSHDQRAAYHTGTREEIKTHGSGKRGWVPPQLRK